MCRNNKYPEPCQQGFYCPPNTGFTLPTCPIGTFGSREGLKLESECTNCTAGSYCASSGLPQPTAPCAPGYWCNNGVNVKNPNGADNMGIGGLCYKGKK